VTTDGDGATFHDGRIDITATRTLARTGANVATSTAATGGVEPGQGGDCAVVHRPCDAGANISRLTFTNDQLGVLTDT